jgi:hypothetical protein
MFIAAADLCWTHYGKSDFSNENLTQGSGRVRSRSRMRQLHCKQWRRLSLKPDQGDFRQSPGDELPQPTGSIYRVRTQVRLLVIHVEALTQQRQKISVKHHFITA